LVAALLAITTAPRAEPLSRATVVARALHQNPQVAAARSRQAQAEAEKVQADAVRWPEITIQAGVGPSLRAALVPGSGSESTRSRYELSASDLSVVVGGRVNVIQPLYTFGKIDGFRSAAEHGVRAREAQARMTQAEVALEAARLYEGLLFARDAARFFEELEHYVEHAIQNSEERVRSEADGEEDLLRLQTALAAVRLSLHYAQAAQEQASAGVAAYLGLPADTELAIGEDQLLPVPMVAKRPARLVSEALRRRPELRALEQGALAYDSLAAAERAGQLPDLFVWGFASGAYTPGRELVESRYVLDPLYHFEPGLMLGARWQIQGSMSRGRSEQREAQARELRELRNWASAGLPAQVKKARADVERARRDIAETRSAVARSKQWMVQANRDYLVGLSDSQSLVDAVRAYAELRAAELDATFRHNVAMAELAHATGSLINDQLDLYPGKQAP
jgi:outer membrane protein TolC